MLGVAFFFVYAAVSAGAFGWMIADSIGTSRRRKRGEWRATGPL